MATIALNVSGLPTLAQLAKGQDVITKGTNNALVPGNADELAEFVTAQADFETANAACEAAKSTSKAKTAARQAAQRVWKAKFKAMAAKTEDITQGSPEALLSAGFDVKADATPPQPLEAPTNLRAPTNGTPGVTKLSADPLPGAVTFLVEMCAAPIVEDNWEQVATPTKPSCTVDGAEAGKKCWFRMAGVNVASLGPWSAPVARPVM